MATQRRARMIVEEIVAHLKPRKVVLFGSAARGGATKGGDLDSLVVMESDKDRLQRAWEVYGLFRDKPKGPVDFIVLTPEEYERLKHPKGNFVEFMRRSPLYGIDLDLKREQSLTREEDVA